MKTTFKSFLLITIFAQNYILAQNAVDVNPQGQNAIVDVKGFGQNTMVGLGRTAFHASTGTISSSVTTVGGVLRSGHSQLNNYGVVGIADGTSTPFLNVGVYGLSDGVVSNKAVGVLARANQKGGHAYGVEATAFLDDASISSKQGIGGLFASTTTANTPNTVLSIGVKGMSSGNGSVNERVGVMGSVSGITNNAATGVIGESNVQNGLGVGVKGETFAFYPGSDIGVGGQFNAYSSINTNGNAELIGVSTGIQGSGTVAQRFGIKMFVSGNSSQSNYGIFSDVTNDNPTSFNNYGAFLKIKGTSISNKYGLYVEAEGAGNLYGAYINQKTGIGVLQPSEMFEVNGRIRLRHNATNAGILLANSSNDLNINNTTFIGMETSTPGSEKFGVRINNDWKLLVGSTGITVPGTINIGSGTLSKYIRIETTMAGTYPANNFVTHSFTATGAAVGDNVILNFIQDIGPLIVSQVWVSASNTVSVKLYNPTASSNNFPTNIAVRVILTR